MRITNLRIKNFKSIRNMYIKEIENALILVGKNNTGKTAVLEAVCAVGGTYQICTEDFQEDFPNIEIFMTLEITEEDLHVLHQNGIVVSTEDMISGFRISAKNCLLFKTVK